MMRAFYTARQKKSKAVAGVGKAEALRQAQLSLLWGCSLEAVVSSGGTQPRRGDLVKKGGTPGATYTLNSQAPFSHPFYWAPFILIGNWK